MSIYNMIASVVGGGGGGEYKVASVQTTTSTNTVQSLSFAVDSQPTAFTLVCIGPSTASTSVYCQCSSSYYAMVGVRSENGTSVRTTYVRGASSSAARYYSTTSYPTISYSNGTLTLTGTSTYVFPACNTNFNATFTYYLFYK